MPEGFWWGVLAVPAGALALAACYAAVLLCSYAYFTWDGELWGGKTTKKNDDARDRAYLVAVLAHSRKLVRFRLIPGWAVIFSRYEHFDKVSLRDVNGISAILMEGKDVYGNPIDPEAEFNDDKEVEYKFDD